MPTSVVRTCPESCKTSTKKYTKIKEADSFFYILNCQIFALSFLSFF